MDTESLLAVGERGTHLLFDTPTIAEAFSQDARELEAVVRGDGAGVERAIRDLLAQPSCAAAREFVDALPRTFRYVIVLLYFELLEGRVRRHCALH
ncbi:MAG TPA: hypothetical protein VNE71_13010, partial [Myxococcota bacterium]|nr:hypothetical protein [Myxococcota bacterium]